MFITHFPSILHILALNKMITNTFKKSNFNGKERNKIKERNLRKKGIKERKERKKIKILL